MYSVTKRYSFEAGHRLDTAYTRECLFPHGHSYKLEVTVQAVTLNDDGMVIDFKKLDEVVKPIVASLDHTFIEKGEKFDYNPTAENLAYDIGRRIKAEINNLHSIRLWETEKAYAEVTF